MVSDGIPPIRFRLFNDAGPYGIKIDIGQAVDKGLAVFNDNAFKSVSPEKSATIMPLVVVS
jgi:hypothetical protein